LRHLYIKCIILPRQARDNHRESTLKKGTVFPQVLLPFRQRGDQPDRIPRQSGSDGDEHYDALHVSAADVPRRAVGGAAEAGPRRGGRDRHEDSDGHRGVRKRRFCLLFTSRL
jgi:hypothetical protein